ncbi:Schizosaccharomyces specific protein [Schizosaccharomyces osmophilus]|uniref:Schizosaccharomyces specific protein n=1 Tax=Schizosaccharomyces osmophilus TaxID=2545709 RepID=A0AAE9W9S4_9SCHI|nr:Schizosaccharomyces specific protein [Schizosaccharomyces osmophilus]WBW71968.1 Schizosaccharomyces specific protein [Schizosaccharomyces osmophilus]
MDQKKNWIDEFHPSSFTNPIEKLNILLPKQGTPQQLATSSQQLLNQFQSTLNNNLSVLNHQIQQICGTLPRLPTMISALDHDSRHLSDTCDSSLFKEDSLNSLREIETIRKNLELTIAEVDKQS